MRKAALRVSGTAIDEPNVILALASSYNERGTLGFTHAVTNSEDQRKINCFFELVKNALTGKGTLTLSKRPGVADSSSGAGYGSATQDVYLITIAPITSNSTNKQGTSVSSWVVSVSGGNIVVSSDTVDTTIEGFGTRFPCYIDKTIIAGVETIVLQDAPFASSSAHNVWYSSAIAIWTQILDADFTGLIHRGKMEHMDGYAFILEAQNRIFNSDINSLANWTVTSFLTKQIVQDIPVGLMKLNNHILAMGQDTAEAFYNAGNTTGSPLLPLRHIHQRIGLIAPGTGGAPSGSGHYYCTIGNRLFFVGRISGGIKSAGVFTYNGQGFEKVSSPYIDKILSEVVPSAFYSVNAVGFYGQQAMAILLTSPNATSQRWLMFFPEWKEWFEWTSTVFSPINNTEHFLSCGTSLKDKIYNFPASDNWQDNAVSYAWSTQFKLPTNGASLKFMPMYGVDADTDASANSLTVEISTNDCVSFSTLGTIDQTQDRKVLFGGGSFRKAHIRLGNTNARPSRIHNFLARIE